MRQSLPYKKGEILGCCNDLCVAFGTNHTNIYGYSILASISCPFWCNKNTVIVGIVYNNIVRENNTFIIVLPGSTKM